MLKKTALFLKDGFPYHDHYDDGNDDDEEYEGNADAYRSQVDQVQADLPPASIVAPNRSSLATCL